MPRLRCLALLLLAFVAGDSPATRPASAPAPRSADGLLLLAPAPSGLEPALDAPAEARPMLAARLAARLADGAMLRDLAHASSWLARTRFADDIDAARRDAAPALTARDLLAIEGAGTYLPEIFATGTPLVTRWASDANRTIRVWVAAPPGSTDAGDRARTALVMAAFEDWREAGVPLGVTLVADSAMADVQLRWVRGFETPISGRTRWTHDATGWIRRGDITLALHYPNGAPLDAAALRAIAMHEIGHLLGLDHTADSTSIMAPVVRARELTAADRASARLLYRLPAGPLH